MNGGAVQSGREILNAEKGEIDKIVGMLRGEVERLRSRVEKLQARIGAVLADTAPPAPKPPSATARTALGRSIAEPIEILVAVADDVDGMLARLEL